jgi:beta-1,4-mannosyltransferase
VRVGRFDVLLVQNPPAVPTLLVGVVVARARGARLIVDWHNFGYAMLALKVGPHRLATRLARRYERALARRADGHLCVSHAMRTELVGRWGVADAVVLHDRPAARFVPTAPETRRALLERLHDALRLPALRRPPALLVSPSSWTEDEDFDVLIDAAERCDAAMANDAAVPDLLIVATGDGPLRERYAQAMAARALRRVHLRTIWLAADDYVLLVGAADLGLCFHRSTSGVDLPMKVADFLGAGVPVCALDYGPCLREVLRDGENGVLFTGAADLAGHLLALFRGWPDEARTLAELRRNVAGATRERWADAWTAAARPLFVP